MVNFEFHIILSDSHVLQLRSETVVVFIPMNMVFDNDNQMIPGTVFASTEEVVVMEEEKELLSVKKYKNM